MVRVGATGAGTGADKIHNMAPFGSDTHGFRALFIGAGR
jgi:hypothetical protein